MTDTSVILAAQRDSVRAVARRFGVPDDEISVAPRQGQVNLTIFLGRDLVLRLPRKPEFAKRLATEAAVIPFVRERGIPTAELILFDPTHSIADATYIVLERLHGQTIDELPATSAGGERTRRSLCEVLFTLHRNRESDETMITGVEPGEFSTGELLDELADEGEIGRTQAAWLAGWFRHLEENGAHTSASVLLHGDVMPSNLVLDESGAVTAVIDWGSARWGEAARDLAGLRTSDLPIVVDAYRDVIRLHRGDAGQSGVALEAGVLWYQLFFALAKLLGRRSTSERRNWSAPRDARLLELLRFVSGPVPERWSTLLRR